MFQSIKQAWHHFAAHPPGARFHQTYLSHRSHRASGFKRIAFLSAGVAIIAAGVFALVAPGPGLLMIGLGTALIARESEKLSRVLDRLELWIRGRMKRLRSRSG